MDLRRESYNRRPDPAQSTFPTDAADAFRANKGLQCATIGAIAKTGTCASGGGSLPGSTSLQESSDSGLKAAGVVAHDRNESGVAVGRQMLLRAISAFIVLPGMVAFAIPIGIGASTGNPVQHSVAAAAVVCAGTVLLLWCVREFYVAGRGTLAPWSPPKRLVVSGPYRFTRNPMYVSVVTIVLGWSVLWDSRMLIYYALGTLATVYVRVRMIEEPWAARTFGSQWEAYRGRVPRWFV